MHVSLPDPCAAQRDTKIAMGSPIACSMGYPMGCARSMGCPMGCAMQCTRPMGSIMGSAMILQPCYGKPDRPCHGLPERPIRSSRGCPMGCRVGLHVPYDGSWATPWASKRSIGRLTGSPIGSPMRCKCSWSVCHGHFHDTGHEILQGQWTIQLYARSRTWQAHGLRHGLPIV